ncbi:MAG: type 4a pilus biogenesis protein PilO [Actinobacteria bacterium]|nr:type 4a pilus biogenesis protein PilO [Actinomycetota bacterium]
MSRRLLAFGTLVFLLVTVLWYFFLLSPRNSKISDLDDQLQTAIAEEDALRAAAAALRDVQENDVAFLAAIGQMEAGIPEEPELAVFIEEVTALAESTGIAVQSIAPSEPAASATLPVYDITVTLALQGEYFELLGFLYGLDDMERIVVVQAISITAGGGGGAVEELPEEETSTTVEGESTTTTTIPTLSENTLSISLTVKLFTRTPLLPAVAVANDGAGDGTTEGDAFGGTFGQDEFGIDSPEAPSGQAAGGDTP